MALPVENATATIDQVTIRQFQLKNKKQMNRITLAATDNFELQTTLIAEIETYETLQGTASAAGTSSGRCSGGRSHSEERECGQGLLGNSGRQYFERYQWNSKRWKPEPSTHLVMYSEPRLRKFYYERIFKKEETGQLLEYGWDVSLSSNDQDFVATPDKHVLFNRLRQSYHKRGVPIHVSVWLLRDLQH